MHNPQTTVCSFPSSFRAGNLRSPLLLPNAAHPASSSTRRWIQALFDLEATNAELKSDLRDLYIVSASEVDVSASRKAIVIHVSAGPLVGRAQKGGLPRIGGGDRSAFDTRRHWDRRDCSF